MSIFDTADKRVLSKSELGLVIKHLRELRQWSQETLAQLAHTTDRTIQRIEAGSGTSVHTLRALAVAFGFQDIDAFTKPMAIPTDEQLQAACEQFEKDYVVNKAHKPESGRCLAKLAEESVGDYIEPACELSQDQALTLQSSRIICGTTVNVQSTIRALDALRFTRNSRAFWIASANRVSPCATQPVPC